jgi:hypothetical protein
MDVTPPAKRIIANSAERELPLPKLLHRSMNNLNIIPRNNNLAVPTDRNEFPATILL